MGLLENVEKKISQGFTSLFGRFGKRELQPIEIVDGLRSAMDTSTRSFGRNRVVVPYQYLVTISRRDFDRIQGPGLTKAITAEMTKHARNQGYSMAGEMEIRIRGEAELKAGSLQIEPQGFSGEVEWSARISCGKDRFELRRGTSSIGRAPGDADIMLQDRALSRKHFEIAWNGQSAAIRDCGSTNGTRVNGELIPQAEPAALPPGSRISAGKSEFYFELIPKVA